MTHPAPRATRPDLERFLATSQGELGITDLGGIHIDPQELSELVVDHGQPAELRRAQLCPCIRPESQQARGNCGTCRGLGWFHPVGDKYREPVIALILSQQLQRDFRQAGHILTGTVQVTFPLGIVPGEADILLPEVEEHVISETLWRLDRPIRDRLVRARQTTSDQAAPKTAPFRERLIYPDVISVESIWYWDDETQSPVETFPGHDYLDEFHDGEVRWHPGRGPDPGKAYTVRYRAPAAYMLEPGEPIFRSEHGAAFPYKVVGQRLDRWTQKHLDVDRTR